MSYADDRSAELDAQLERAWQKCLYGRKYSRAYALASRIKDVRLILKEKEREKGESIAI